MNVLPEHTQRFLRAVGPQHDDVQDEMAAHADAHGFPIIGPDAGGVLRAVARMTGAKRAFEFGSGFGYSAYWLLRGMPEDAEIVLTEFDADELEQGREFFQRAGFANRATFEHGDAVSIIDEYDGPFDVVLVDHQKRQYPEAFEKVREKVRVGGVVVADNIMRGPVDLDALLAYVEGEQGELEGSTAAIARYLETLEADESYETIVLPVGSGIAVSTRIE